MRGVMTSHTENHLYAVVIAGVGTRMFWPLEREARPMPFLDPADMGSLLQGVLHRAEGIVPREHIVLVAGLHAKSLLEGVGELYSEHNLLIEPVWRGTAASVALAAAHVRKLDAEAVLLVIPADHVVHDEEACEAVLRQAVAVASVREAMVVVGIEALRPETGCGYIQKGAELPLPEPETPEGSSHLYAVRAVVEKADYATAVDFISSGDFCWNSGIFITRVDLLLHEFSRWIPELYRDLLSLSEVARTRDFKRVSAEVYAWLHRQSIESCLMEKSKRVVVLTGEFGWAAPCTWDDIIRLKGTSGGDEKEVVLLESEGVFVRKPPGRVVCCIGVSGLIVVDAGDALLICCRGEAGRVPGLLEELKRRGMDEVL
ncbi:hypothetical protein EKD02_05910 [Chlorobium phaeovibrioides]|uniref:Uncharacterized protein n=2 Tax=Chlorobium phaeovibrioides TaxID=1094 RepID=A0A432AVB8_CHLPH|nr:hypothetical protein EKD02_05910 [Chlorobium phaeovibrioides]